MAEVATRRRSHASASDSEVADDLRGSDAETDSEYETDEEGSDGEVEGERNPADGESPHEDVLDDDEDVKNPAFIPRKGAFYEHDLRDADENAQKPAEEERPNKKLWKEKEKWQHDCFDERAQAPKSREELIGLYGYDIRSKDSPPEEAPRPYTRGRGRRDRRGGGRGSASFGDFYNSRSSPGRGRRGMRQQGLRRGSGNRAHYSYSDRDYGRSNVNENHKTIEANTESKTELSPPSSDNKTQSTSAQNSQQTEKSEAKATTQNVVKSQPTSSQPVVNQTTQNKAPVSAAPTTQQQQQREDSKPKRYSSQRQNPLPANQVTFVPQAGPPPAGLSQTGPPPGGPPQVNPVVQGSYPGNIPAAAPLMNQMNQVFIPTSTMPLMTPQAFAAQAGPGQVIAGPPTQVIAGGQLIAGAPGQVLAGAPGQVLAGTPAQVMSASSNTAISQGGPVITGTPQLLGPAASSIIQATGSPVMNYVTQPLVNQQYPSPPRAVTQIPANPATIAPDQGVNIGGAVYYGSQPTNNVEPAVTTPYKPKVAGNSGDIVYYNTDSQKHNQPSQPRAKNILPIVNPMEVTQDKEQETETSSSISQDTTTSTDVNTSTDVTTSTDTSNMSTSHDEQIEDKLTALTLNQCNTEMSEMSKATETQLENTTDINSQNNESPVVSNSESTPIHNESTKQTEEDCGSEV